MVAVPFFLLRHQIGLLFTSDASVCQLVAQLALVIIVYQFGDGLQITYSNALWYFFSRQKHLLIRIIRCCQINTEFYHFDNLEFLPLS